ncbi:hypothetical protein HOY80DRAFT_523845 [Tuber brumale]|nr:hypothetical protein HOY80DRAFT_523845 [Tuber brumale]
MAEMTRTHVLAPALSEVIRIIFSLHRTGILSGGASWPHFVLLTGIPSVLLFFIAVHSVTHPGILGTHMRRKNNSRTTQREKNKSKEMNGPSSFAVIEVLLVASLGVLTCFNPACAFCTRASLPRIAP